VQCCCLPIAPIKDPESVRGGGLGGKSPEGVLTLLFGNFGIFLRLFLRHIHMLYPSILAIVWHNCWTRRQPGAFFIATPLWPTPHVPIHSHTMPPYHHTIPCMHTHSPIQIQSDWQTNFDTHAHSRRSCNELLPQLFQLFHFPLVSAALHIALSYVGWASEVLPSKWTV